MAVDPDLQAKVLAVSGASPDRADDPEVGAATARAFVTVEVDADAAQAAPLAIVAIDEAGLVRVWNPAAARTFGWSADEVVGHPSPLRFLEPGPDPLAALADAPHGGAVHDVRASVRRRDGDTAHVVLAATRLRPPAGAGGLVLFAADETARRQAELATEAANHRWRHLLMNISDTISIADPRGRIVETTGDLGGVLGYPVDSIAGTDGFQLIHPDDRARADEFWATLMASSGGEVTDVLRTRHADGHYELVEFRGTNLSDDPVIGGAVLTTRVVTRERETEQLLADEAEVLELIAKDAPLPEILAGIAALVERHHPGPAPVFLLDAEGAAMQVGAAGTADAELLDRWCATAWLPGLPFDLLVPTTVDDLARDPATVELAPVAARAGVVAVTTVPIRSTTSGATIGLLALLRGADRRASSLERQVGSVAADLAALAIERDRWREELLHQIRHDPVTGLPNRAAIREHLEAALARPGGPDERVAVMLIDLDRFKVVNDSLGHAAGDLLLARFGGRLANLVRPGDFVGHFGADTFVVILEGVTGRDEIRFVASRLEVALGEPFALEENEVYVSASIGVAVGDEVGAAEHADELIQHADAATFRAKELGRGRLEIFDHAMRRRAGERLRIDRDLRTAIERKEFEVHYQPEIDLTTGSITGVEALLRWHHPELGLLLPEDFLDVAEDTGVIVSIGTWVLGEALAQATRWAGLGGDATDLSLSVNLSSRQLGSPALVPLVASELRRFDWPPARLVVELDESMLLVDRELTLGALNELQHLGVRIAIDDFGTGYSSLSYLHRFPIDVVKIDPSFVAPLQRDGTGSPVVTAIVAMAHDLGIVAAAGGVEQEEQLVALRHLGCDRAQGFHFSGAVPAGDLTALVQAARRW